ncbi:MAG: pirin family protein, partial [Akkermansiaceae bacterium]|nr:pirin family protein [Akkermansiaceae bacterium]
MAVTLRRSADRGHANHGWLDARHSFSFADYHDPAHMSYRSLRVINDDTIAPGKGFGMHPHESMEIFTFIKEGVLRHQDSMGNSREIRAGEFQYMSAGSGVLHSEVNPSPDKPVKLLQIWITPARPGGEPRYR